MAPPATGPATDRPGTLELVVARPEGLYCPPGDFYIDPWRPVEHAVITHAHGDHARIGSGHYLAAAAGEVVLRTRLGAIDLQPVPYGEVVEHRGVRISFHPAGHVLGSAQVRLEHGGRVWVVSGDYKTEDDGVSAAFEPVRCDTFITESTFGLPIYRWAPQVSIFQDIADWWQRNAADGRTSILYCYALGKAQRILAGLELSIGPVVTHGAVATVNQAYRASGIPLPHTRSASEFEATGTAAAREARAELGRALVLAPPSAARSPWLRRFPDPVDAFASGWMQLRGARRRRGVDRGFVLSDHADWPGLGAAIRATGAARVLVTHGSVGPMVRWLREHGLDADAVDTRFSLEDDS
jgi:putative mRNA 3-end processing factor